jgi:rifampicin phosphotransferase
MGRYVLDLQELDATRSQVAGGKGANLGELSRLKGIRVPAGFCVTTDAFKNAVAGAPSLGGLLDGLSLLEADDREGIRVLSGEVRRVVEAIGIPANVEAEVRAGLARHGEREAYAVRSSATAEDLPTASFAGQQDSYLNVVGAAAVLRQVTRCWASLFSARAVTYRLRNGVDHSTVRMAVVVQRMVFPEVSGVVFTADPITGNRKVAVLEAAFGLGESLVSGIASPDVFRVRDGEVLSREIGAKRLAIQASPLGGIREAEINPERAGRSTLTDAQAVGVVQLARRIEAHFGRPQDIEWCLVDDDFHVVQSRPITTLFPVPEAADGENHVYVSVGHQQMMTDAMKPLGLSFWQMTTPRPMAEAGGRLFVDVTRILASPGSSGGFLEMVGKSDPLIRDALQTVIDRGDFIPPLADDGPAWVPPGGAAPAPIETDPALVAALIQRTQASVASARREIRDRTGPGLLDFILADIQELRRILFDPRSLAVIMAGMEAVWWLNQHLQEWLGIQNAADVLTRSVLHNVTSEMGLALLDVADAIRPHPEVITFLHGVQDERFVEELERVAGGDDARAAIGAWLEKYGMRGPGEIDITRPRWSERPSMLLPLILGNLRNTPPGEAVRRFEQGLREAGAMEREVLERLRALPDGAGKAAETKRMIDRVRTFAGYREHPKYGMVSRYFLYKQALIEEAARLVRAAVLHHPEDAFFLTFPELHHVVRTQQADGELIRERRAAFRWYQGLVPPRVLTSDGESVAGAYRRKDLPAGALAGLAVSAGRVEGRARVVRDMTQADLQPGDILVTTFTDPSWTPLFVTVAGLVTEVGGLMTHGAVIAREYGLPAVVGVEHATRLIRDGQRIRVHGTEGYVEILDPG